MVVAEKPVILADDNGMQESCKLMFTGVEKYNNILTKYLKQ